MNSEVVVSQVCGLAGDAAEIRQDLLLPGKKKRQKSFG